MLLLIVGAIGIIIVLMIVFYLYYYNSKSNTDQYPHTTNHAITTEYPVTTNQAINKEYSITTDEGITISKETGDINTHGKDVGLNNEKEVFNIDENKYTYKEAKKVCKAFNGELATLSQLKLAYDNGANWCNYGWSANKMALYPIQQSYYNKIRNTDLEGTCGKPGINGGKFDLNAKLGINCYGIRPKPKEGRLTYMEDSIDINNMEIRPFSDEIWSRYSVKKSTYVLNDDLVNNIVYQEDVDYNKLDPRIIDMSNENKEKYPEDESLEQQLRKFKSRTDLPTGIKLRKKDDSIIFQTTTEVPIP